MNLIWGKSDIFSFREHFQHLLILTDDDFLLLFRRQFLEKSFQNFYFHSTNSHEVTILDSLNSIYTHTDDLCVTQKEGKEALS